MKILLLEPDEYYHTKFSEALGSLGELRISTQAAEAKNLVEREAPDALIMDLLLPDYPGYQFLAELEEQRQQHRLPVIIFSRVDHLEDVTASLNQGIAGYFVKGQDTIQDIKKLLLTLPTPSFSPPPKAEEREGVD